MGKTSIEWTDRTWSPIRARVKENAAKIAKAKGYTSLLPIAEKMVGRVGPHCEHISPGCENCYAGTNNRRCLPGNGTGLPYDRRSRDLVETFVDEKILIQPLNWKERQRVFVENQSDLFGEWVADKQIDRVFAVMALCPHLTFQILTKRPERMLKWFTPDRWERIRTAAVFHGRLQPEWSWPLANVWLGVSFENQETADERIPLLLKTPAATRFVSYEPALEAVDFGCRNPLFPADPSTCQTDYCPCALDLVIVGGESGPGARPFDLQWARNVIQHCAAAGTACFVKQLGRYPQQEAVFRPFSGAPSHGIDYLRLKDKKGGAMDEWPEDLRVREFPA